MQLSTHEFVALAVDRQLTKLLETQFGNDFGAHEVIIHLNLTPRCRHAPVLGSKEMACFGKVWGSNCRFPQAVVLSKAYFTNLMIPKDAGWW